MTRIRLDLDEIQGAAFSNMAYQRLEYDVPLLSKIGDDEIERLFSDRDGVWSSLTKAAMAAFKVDKIDLNMNWASVSKNWTCPACLRDKADIFRVSSNGVLLALLHEHHDHLEDLSDDLVRVRMGVQWGNVGPGFELLEYTIGNLVSRFRRTLVCHDCNDADGAVKRQFREIPKRFTFKPSEIRAFIKPVPNGKPIIDFDKALQTFAAAESDYRSRADLVAVIVGMVQSGQLKKERTSPADQTFWNNHGWNRYMWSTLSSALPTESNLLQNEFEAYKSRSVSFHGANVSAKGRPQRAPVAPSDDDYNNHAGSGDAKRWAGADERWKCPCCARSKRETMRKSNSKAWSARLYTHSEFIWDDITDAFSGNWRQGWSHVVTHLICQDCFSISPKLKQSYADLRHRSFTLQIENMAPLIAVNAYSAHVIDFEKGLSAALEVEKFEPGLKEFLRYYSTAIETRKAYRRAVEESGDADQAFSNEVMRKCRREGRQWRDIEQELTIWLAEADRLESLDPGFEFSHAKWGT